MMEKLVWSPQISLGVPAMDDARKTFIEELTALLAAPDHEFADRLFTLIARLERDFREEEALIEKIDFLDLQSHREQHASVLSALHRVVPDVMQGGCTSARKVIELLPLWILYHLSTMDMALASALNAAGLQAHLPRKPESVNRYRTAIVRPPLSSMNDRDILVGFTTATNPRLH